MTPTDQLEMPKQIFDWLLLAIGVLIAAVGLNCFLLPNHFIDGGITGISMLLADLTGVALSPCGNPFDSVKLPLTVDPRLSPSESELRHEANLLAFAMHCNLPVHTSRGRLPRKKRNT